MPGQLRTQALDDANLLRHYFVLDKRCNFRGLLSHGGYGSAHRVDVKDPQTGVVVPLVVKKTFDNPIARSFLDVEKHWLTRLRGAQHIVQLHQIHNDPLRPIGGGYVVLEYLQHGTLANFITKARRRGIDRLPNRLLWRFFLCLVRACIAMAYPPNRNDAVVLREEVQVDVAPSRLAHGDLHNENVLLDEPLYDDEHGITPILKMIDFGYANDTVMKGRPYSGVESNLWDIGELMICLVFLVEIPLFDIFGDSDGGVVEVSFGGQTRKIDTLASDILPISGPSQSIPWLDPELAGLVCACLSRRERDRPSLQEVVTEVIRGVKTNTAELYIDSDREEDDAIARLWVDISNYAETGQREETPISSQSDFIPSNL